jgi:hypothetical protein
VAERILAWAESVAAKGGAFIVRLTRSYDPWVRTAWLEGISPRDGADPVSRFLAQHAGQRMDLDVQFNAGPAGSASAS